MITAEEVKRMIDQIEADIKEILKMLGVERNE